MLQHIIKYGKLEQVSYFQSIIKHTIIPFNFISDQITENSHVLDIGCGEGILDNYLGVIRPDISLFGCDLDKQKIETARLLATTNCSFDCIDFFDLETERQFDLAIVNDMLHHLSYDKQMKFLMKLKHIIKPDGILILKEVDLLDKLDFWITNFFDSKIYPKDDLSFRSVNDWKMFFERCGFELDKVKKVIHPWIASRTVMVCQSGSTNEVNKFNNIKLIKYENFEWKNNNPDGVICFITGATGFIGSHLLDEIEKNGINGKKTRIIILSRKYIDTNHTLILGDLDDLPFLSDALEGVDYVYHLAAEVKFFKGENIVRNNLIGTKSVLKALNGKNPKKLVYTSTIGVHDRSSLAKCENLLNEESEYHPTSIYGQSKLSGEEAVKESGLNYTIIRIPWAYGSRMTPDTHVRKLFEMVINNKIVTKFNFPGRVSITPVSDLIRAFIFLTEKNEADKQIFFVTDGAPIELGTLFKEMGQIAGNKTAIFRIPKFVISLVYKIRGLLPITVKNLTMDVLVASNQKINQLGFTPKVSVRQELKNLYDDILD